MFAFSKGQELSEHTSAMAAILHVLEGRATITLGEETIEGERDCWIHIPPQMPHSILAQTDFKMILLLVKSSKAQ